MIAANNVLTVQTKCRHNGDMQNTATTNQPTDRFEELRIAAGLSTEGEYEVRSTGMFGHFDTIGRTDDVRLAIYAAKMLTICHAVPCEEITAHAA